MSRFTALVVFILLQLGFLVAGLKTSPILIIGFPLLIVILGYLIYYPVISLLLFNLSAIVKGFLINQIPIFEVIDYSFLFTVIIWFGLFRIIMIGKWKLPDWSKQLLLFYLLFCMFLAYSVFYTPSPSYGLQKVIRFIVFNSTMFFTPFIIIKSLEDSKKMLLLLRNLLVLITMLMVIYILYYLSVSSGISVLMRISILGANPIAVGSFLAVATGLFAITMIRTSYKKWILYFPVLIVLIIGLISTGSRGPIISLVLSLITYLLLFEKKYRKKGFILNSTIILFVILLLFLLPENLTGRYLDYTTGDLVIQREGVKRVSTIAMRWQYWQLSINQWISDISTTLFGLGTGGFSSLYILRDYRFYPHNMFVEVIVELGLIGLTLFILFWGQVYKIIKKTNFMFSTIISLWFTAFLIRFFGSQFSGDLGGNRDMWLYLSMTLISIILEQRKNNIYDIKKT